MKLLWMVLLLGGCATSGVANFEAIIKNRASFDFDCNKDSIKTTKLNETDFKADGCGKSQNYSLSCSLGPCVAKPK